jgi:hypothetical protein
VSSTNYYHQCKQRIGRPVQITMRDGSVHRGIIDRVTPNRLYLRPLRPNRNYGGFGYGGYGGYGLGVGLATGFALGAITSLAFLPYYW